jgi:hypothetical protein
MVRSISYEFDEPPYNRNLPTRTTSTLVQSLKLMLQRIELVIVKLLELYELRPCSGSASDEFIELQLQRSRVTVLGVLQQERNKKRHLGRSRVHRQLPRI